MTPAKYARLDLLARKSKRPTEELVELWEERAAIREFDGGKRRMEAEAYAFDDVARIVLC